MDNQSENNFFIINERYVILKTLNIEPLKEVYKILVKDYGNYSILKIFPIPSSFKNIKKLISKLNSLDLKLQDLSPESFMKISDIFTTSIGSKSENYLWVIEEIWEGPTLEKYLKKYKRLEEDEISSWIQNINIIAHLFKQVETGSWKQIQISDVILNKGRIKFSYAESIIREFLAPETTRQHEWIIDDLNKAWNNKNLDIIEDLISKEWGLAKIIDSIMNKR